jgi:hypothetical protein
MGIAIIIDWFGPYAGKEALSESMKGYDEGTKCLYMAAGHDGRVRYLGRTERPATRLNNHEAMALAHDCDFFCGNIVSQGVGGRRARQCKTDLGTAERALIVALQPEKNKNLKEGDIGDCVVIYSRFWKAESEDDRTEPPTGFPTILAYDSWSKRWDARK